MAAEALPGHTYGLPPGHGVGGRIQTCALVLPSFHTGGAERVIINLANGLQSLGVTTNLVVLDPNGPMRDLVAPEVPIVDLDRPRARRAAVALASHLRRRPTDAVIVSQTHLSLLLCLLRPAMPRATRLIVREPTLWQRWPRWLRLTQRVLLPFADLVIASSVPMQNDLDRLLRGRSCVVTLPNPVDVEALRRQAAAVPALGPEIDPATPPAEPGIGRRFIAVGRLIPSKGIDELLEAFAAVAGPEDHLDIVGDGPLREALEARAARLALGPRVQFLGRLDAPAARVADADLLVQASHFEGMPNAVLEALAVGTPVLATTDLTMLAEVASSTTGSAIRLIPRSDLAIALSESTALRGPIPRPSLLPEEFGRDRVATELLGLLDPGCA